MAKIELNDVQLALTFLWLLGEAEAVNVEVVTEFHHLTTHTHTGKAENREDGGSI